MDGASWNNWPIFSSSPFAVRFNLLHPQPSLFLFGLLLPLVFFYLSKLLFWGFLQFEGDFTLRKNDLKYCDIAPLIKTVLFIKNSTKFLNIIQNANNKHFEWYLVPAFWNALFLQMTLKIWTLCAIKNK